MASGWGAFLTGLSHTTQQLPALMQRNQAIQLEAQKLEQTMKDQERQRDLKAVDEYFKVMSSEHYADELKINANNNVAKIFKKWDLGDIPQLTEWDPSYKQYGNKLAKTSESFFKGEMPAKVALENIHALYGQAKTERERKLAEKAQADVAKEGVIRKEGSPEDQLRFKALLSKDTREALDMEGGPLGYHIEKEQLGASKQVQDYRVFVDKKGNVVKREPVGQPYSSQEKIAEIRIPSFAPATDLPPGYTFNRKSGKFAGPDGKEVSPEEFAGLFADKSELTGQKQSIAQMQKTRGMMGSYVSNMDKQISRVEQIHKDLVNRVGVRALDMPMRELRKRFMGSGNEAILEAYTTEISNEIGKISTGSVASIRELSTEAQERWARIHDPNLSFNELMKILRETSHMGKLRVNSLDEEITKTRKSMGKKSSAPKEDDYDAEYVPGKGIVPKGK